MTAGATRRLFFALWPDAATRAAIEARRDALGALSKRVVPAANFHVTLVFLGDQPAERLASIEDDAERIRPRCRGFALRMDRFGWFARARVAWLGGQPPVPGAALAGELHRGLSALGLAPDARPWRPHITLFRGVTRRPELPRPDPLDWDVTSFALVESVPGHPYQVLRTWCLE